MVVYRVAFAGDDGGRTDSPRSDRFWLQLAGFGFDCKLPNRPDIGVTKMTRYKLAFYVPVAHAIAVKRAIFATGAGSIGNYRNCAFQVRGQGQFSPMEGANPAIGEVGKEEIVEEYKVEILCSDEENTRDAVRELKKAHPYEEVAYEVYKVEDF